MNILDELKNHILEIKPVNKKMQIILDIDDTLIDCRHRKHRVFMDFLDHTAARSLYPTDSAKLQSLSYHEIQYRIEDNLKLAGCSDESFAKDLFTFWRQNYFTYSYLTQDQAFPGAVEFVHQCINMGIQVTYLSGRDLPGMGQGTFDTLKILSFPCEGPNIHFYLKPEATINDFDFKTQALDLIASQGIVLAAIENELTNLNAMADHFKNALMYWRPTLYMPNPPRPHPRVKILEFFPKSRDPGNLTS